MKTGTVYGSMIYVKYYREDFGQTDAAIGKYLAGFYPDGPEKQLLLSGKFKLVETDYDWTLNSQEQGEGAGGEEGTRRSGTRARMTASRPSLLDILREPVLEESRARLAASWESLPERFRTAADVRPPGQLLRGHPRRDAAVRLRVPRLLPRRRGQPRAAPARAMPSRPRCGRCGRSWATTATCSSPTAR